ncbi:MAG: electron transport complex subunit RsxC [Bacteroidales bacterium]|nr:electron transport complex subunit RsxC [Bacteroidales bacterium]
MLKTFAKGGVHPPENKLTENRSITTLPVPDAVTIPLTMHLGVPAKPIVEKGEVVKAGQLIAEGNGFVSANIHSSVSGKVLKIDKTIDASGYKYDSIFIQTEGDDYDESIDQSDELIESCSLSQKEIIQKINDAGIVGMGGATFPSHVKLTLPRGKSAGFLIINGVECEPYLTSDHALMLEKGEELMVGIRILAKALGVKRTLIGIEKNKPDAINRLSEFAHTYKNISVHPLRVKYPQGGEKQLIKALINREVPSGGLPVDVGTVVFNVGTSYAVYEAVQKNKPLIERIVTVTGKSLANPSNFRVRIGTGINILIEAAGGLPENTGKIISGGPMMGKALASTQIPVTKGTSGILILDEQETRRKEVEPCIRCAKCIIVCPMGLEPYLLMTLSEKSLFDRLEADRVTDCIECGSCSYVCPANRPLLDYIRLGKSNVGKIIRMRKK